MPLETRPEGVTVSVVIPTYGHRDYVEETLASVFAQRFTGYEVIVVVDGSPDDTAEILRPLAAAGRIRLIEQENRGQAAAREAGWRAAGGEFIAFLDDDDLWPPDKLEWQAALLRDSPAAVLVYGDYARLMPDGSLHPDLNTGFPSGRVAREFRLRNWLQSPGQALLRRSALERVGGFDPGIWGSDDWEMYLRLAETGEFLYRRRTALHYRVHAANASRQAIRHAQNHLRVVRRHLGWNPLLVIPHQLSASSYFVPRLLLHARECRKQEAFAAGLKACLYALLFNPLAAAQPYFAAQFLGSLLRLRPRKS